MKEEGWEKQKYEKLKSYQNRSNSYLELTGVWNKIESIKTAGKNQQAL